MRRGLGRTGLEMGLTAVTATQLWHHLWISGDLADLPRMRNAEFGVRNESTEPATARG
jgi:asparagine synthase (glutamine-hydrolysing)